MNEPKSAPKAPKTPMSLFQRGADGRAPQVEMMPQPDLRVLLPMRDGVRLETCVWLPAPGHRPAAAILVRTPYIEPVLGWKRAGYLVYREAGFALVIQTIRGVPPSEGGFSFNNPLDRDDGYDTIAWIAAQDWCGGRVGMDGTSYGGMTQLSAAAARPPNLACMAVHVPSVDFFREAPYFGGGFSRLHTINWTNLISVKSLADLTGGFLSAMPILGQPEWFERMRSRPVVDAADGFLAGDKLDHYRDVLAHPTFDAWWRSRTLGPEHYAAMDLPLLLVTGNFDLSIGALTAWRALETHAPAGAAERNLLIGPWDHGQSYVGGGDVYGPYDLSGSLDLDLPALRMEFFKRHLHGEGKGVDLGGRVRLFVTGANEWRTFAAYPPTETRLTTYFLSSGGRANTWRGDGRLLSTAPGASEPADQFIADPQLPFVPVMAHADPRLLLDLREAEKHAETLVYSTPLLAEPLTLLGEGAVTLHVAADTPDCDIAVWLGETTADGQSIRLATGFLRLRYREGFDREVELTPDTPVEVRLPLTYVGHRLPVGSQLRLLVSGGNFPLVDPNPNTGGPIAAATQTRIARQAVLHGGPHPSRLELPTLP